MADIKAKKFLFKGKHRPNGGTDAAGAHSFVSSAGSARHGKLSILSSPGSSELLKLSYVKPTLRSDSFGPGDSHKMALENYYHVQDSLPPEPVPARSLKNGSVMLMYSNAAPPSMPMMKEDEEPPLMCGLTGKPLPYPSVVDPRSVEEEVSFQLLPLRALNKNSREPRRRVLVQQSHNMQRRRKDPVGQGGKGIDRRVGRGKVGGREESDKYDSIRGEGDERSILSSSGDAQESLSDLDSIQENRDSGSEDNSIAKSAAGRSKLKAASNHSKKKVMTSEQIEESLSEMNSLITDMESVGSGEKWATAGIHIKKHFSLLKKGQVKTGSDLYKGVPISRFFERFMNEGPRRGDGCFETDPKQAGVLVLEGLLNRSKQFRNVKRVNRHNSDNLERMKQTPKQKRIIGELEREVLKAQRRLMRTKIWQRDHGRGEFRVKDKRDLGRIFGDESDSGEGEDEGEAAERPKTNEELWLGSQSADLFAGEKEKKPRKEKETQAHSEREIAIAAIDLLEEALVEYVDESLDCELLEVERLAMQACVIEVQARFRGWSWRNSNYKIVNRLMMRSKSRRKKRQAQIQEEELRQLTDEPEVEEGWQLLEDEHGNKYQYNYETGESKWV